MSDIDLKTIQNAGEYGSEFEYDSEEERKRHDRKDLEEPRRKEKEKLPSKHEVETEYEKEESRIVRQKILSLDAFSRHKKLINDYMIYYGGKKADFKRDSSRDKTDSDVLREHHQFLWDEDDEKDAQLSWEKRMAKKYYDKLFKEYCICDLSRFKESKVAMRWRIERELVDGKGQFKCGEKRCSEEEGLRSWEVNFMYVEHGDKKNALVKLRLCPDCSYKLNYKSKKREVKRKRKQEKEERRAKKHRRNSQDGDSDDVDSNACDDSSSTSSPSSSSSSSASTKTSTSEETESEKNLWAGPVKITDEKSREEEFDDYFEDMFL